MTPTQAELEAAEQDFDEATTAVERLEGELQAARIRQLKAAKAMGLEYSATQEEHPTTACEYQTAFASLQSLQGHVDDELLSECPNVFEFQLMALEIANRLDDLENIMTAAGVDLTLSPEQEKMLRDNPGKNED